MKQDYTEIASKILGIFIIAFLFCLVTYGIFMLLHGIAEAVK